MRQYQHFVVAVPTNHLGNQYVMKHVSGYSVWNVTTDSETGELVSVRLRAANCDKPSQRAIDNYTTLHEAGII